MADVMTQERSSGSVPHYCPIPGCRWSFVGPKKTADGYLSVHLRVIHKGVDPRPATAAAADPDADLRKIRARQRKNAAALAEAGGAQGMSAPASPSADATSGEGNGAAPAGPSPSPGAARGSCKTEGCPNDANTIYDRGVYYRLCEEVCIPRRRNEISQAAIARRQADATPKQVAAAEPPTPQPAQEPAPVEGKVADEPLLSLVRSAARGRRELLEAEQRYLEQLRILRRHPDYERVAPIIHDAVERL